MISKLFSQQHGLVVSESNMNSQQDYMHIIRGCGELGYGISNKTIKVISKMYTRMVQIAV